MWTLVRISCRALLMSECGFCGGETQHYEASPPQPPRFSYHSSVSFLPLLLVTLTHIHHIYLILCHCHFLMQQQKLRCRLSVSVHQMLNAYGSVFNVCFRKLRGPLVD